ncbi:cation transporter [Propioniciclava sp. MC1595]|uniref:cation diffusion facilitator family transporter n=1 Tax=Propioniciclava sp. MC1595 TaxID=2760308 RepID=UPI0016627B8C|nr:cation diffusion facilitator family transporter [Propioniciclava sp. MC1595]MBB1496321.1 cation transporter [Propioniciclava sp. MC1595]QTE26275.1 cation transporter [Propioniciclava sp. MC1595]
MSGGHSHGQGAAVSASSRHRWRLAVTFGLTAMFFVVELVAGVVSGSLALISDAGHMAADVVTLGAALLATRLAAMADTTGRRTYGRYRAEVFASGLAVLMMLGVAVYIVVEGVRRFGQPVEPTSGVMLVVGVVGLAINAVGIILLRGGAGESLNVKGAYLEVMADAIGSVGVIVAGLLVLWTGQSFWDTVVALAIAVFVAVRALMLGREVLAVLGQHAPAGVEPQEILTALAEVEGVADVHDLHVWQLTSGMDVATAHLVAADGQSEQAVLTAASVVLREQFEIEHATLQVESASGGSCQGADW